jgi:hypothetical protein
VRLLRRRSKGLKAARGKPVRLRVFDNEPLARLAEQRLRQEGIPCWISSLGVGPGATGSAYYQPQALYVQQADEPLAREVLGLAPKEMGQRPSPAPRSAVGWVSTLIIIIALALVVSYIYLVSRSSG